MLWPKIFRILSAILYELQPMRRKDVVRLLRKYSIIISELLKAFAELSQEFVQWSVSTFKTTKLLWYIYAIMWIGGFVWAAYVEFEKVFVIITLFGVIYMNLGEKRDGEISAYSVFNFGFKRLLGTLTAEQFENEIMHGQRPGLHDPHRRAVGNENDGDAVGDQDAVVQRHVRGKKARRTYEARLERRRLLAEMQEAEEFEN
jgi:hypothetical protein